MEPFVGTCLVLVVAGCIGGACLVLASVLRRAEADGELMREMVRRLSVPPDAPPSEPEAAVVDPGPVGWDGWPVVGSDPTDGWVPDPVSMDPANRAVVLEPGEDPWPHLVGGKDAEWP